MPPKSSQRDLRIVSMCSETLAYMSSMSDLHLTCMRLLSMRHQPHAYHGGEKLPGTRVMVQMLTLFSTRGPVHRCGQATAAIIQDVGPAAFIGRSLVSSNKRDQRTCHRAQAPLLTQCALHINLALLPWPH
jgi:hypothetical protein